MTEGTSRVFVCGGGHQGLSMAAHLALNGVEVSMWNRSPEHIRDVIDTGVIHCRGIVEGDAKISKASSDIEEVYSDFIMVVTPSSAHRDIARLLAPYVSGNTVIVLNPGRTFGAVEFAETLIEAGVRELPRIAETQTIVYTCRRSNRNSVTIYAMKEDVRIAALKGTDIDKILDMMPKCLQSSFTPADSVAETSLSNIGMILHCAPVLMNIGWIESEKVDFKYYYDGISPTIAHFLEKMDNERINTAKSFGYEAESLTDWLKRSYGVDGHDLFECLQNNDPYREIDAPPSIETRYILEDVPNGLVPIEYLGQSLGVKTPNITTIIDLASNVLDTDFRKSGRRYSMELLKRYC